MPKGDRRFRVLMLALVLTSTGLPARAASDTSVPWTSLSESTSCGRPYVGTPMMSHTGWLGDSERILGPIGRYLGRTVGEVRDSLVDWTVPMSGGRSIRVHRAALQAFQQVAANLQAAADQGLWYSITSAAGFNPRTIGGEYQLSRHTLGISADINPARNPYSSDPATLITDMPQWFVQAWRDAGFCWGGDWVFSKDPMHFSWMGPAPGSGGLPPLPPFGASTPYASADVFATGWGGLAASSPMALADVTATGAADVVRFRDHPAGLVMEVMSARSAFGTCSLSRWMVEGLPLATGVPVLGDVDGDSRTDLVSVTPGGGVTVSTRTWRFWPPTHVDAPVPSDLRSAVIGDLDGDRKGDLVLLAGDGTLTVLGGPAFSALATTTVPPTVIRLAAGDRDGDGNVEVFALDFSGEVSVLQRGPDGSLAFTETASVAVEGVVALAAVDIDGDLRADLATLGADGVVRTWIGNSPTGRPASAWWVDPIYRCPDHPIPLSFLGTFFDDDRTWYESAIERIAALGVTSGCNPPFGDAFCPTRSVTRAEMAAFLVRALGLSPAPDDPFVDDDGHPLQADIAALAAAGITRGCAPGLFCPEAPVTRAEMAAFLVRAGSLAPASTPGPFVDDDGHPLEPEIDALAAAGITNGCAPDRFCPWGAVSRGEMAVFLVRLLDR